MVTQNITSLRMDTERWGQSHQEHGSFAMEQVRLIDPVYEDGYARRCHHEVQGCRKPV
jgi:hypothetical protein